MKNKDIIRKEALRHRDRMDFRNENPDEACRLFFEHVKPRKDQVVSVYWPLPMEFDIHPVIERLLKEGYKCALPFIRKGTLELGFAYWNEGGELQKNDKNVYEPVLNGETETVDPDIVITPLLAFDRKGYRLGRGGGYYDATLAALRSKKPIIAVGLAYAQQACLFNLPVEDHDQKLDWVITPAAAHYFGA